MSVCVRARLRALRMLTCLFVNSGTLATLEMRHTERYEPVRATPGVAPRGAIHDITAG